MEATLATITEEERNKLCALSWDELWRDVSARGTASDKARCASRFRWLQVRELVGAMERRGHRFRDQNEWGLPKGRMSRVDGGDARRCAVREVAEETGLLLDPGVLDGNASAVERVGTDGRMYRATFFVARALTAGRLVPQRKEVRRVRWATREVYRELLGQELSALADRALDSRTAGAITRDETVKTGESRGNQRETRR